jgi:DeoR/GlpR family transcriptional regulator of sugar metabolism
LSTHRRLKKSAGRKGRSTGNVISDAEPPRFAEERRAKLLNMLRQRGRLEVLELAETFQVSEHTIRRDLNQLHDAGVLQKTHGGAVMLESARMSFDERSGLLGQAKAAMGRAAAARIVPGSTVILDAGSSTLALARALTARPLNVITNSLDIAALFQGDSAVQLLLTGGTWVPRAHALRGVAALNFLASCRADWVALGACSLDVAAGATVSEEDDAVIKRAMVAAAVRTMVLADHSKRGSVSPFQVASWKQISLLVTDNDWADVAQLGVEVHTSPLVS